MNCFSVHVVIATPGRILDLMNKEIAKMNRCATLVMDEVCKPLSCYNPFYKLSFFILTKLVSFFSPALEEKRTILCQICFHLGVIIYYHL